MKPKGAQQPDLEQVERATLLLELEVRSEQQLLLVRQRAKQICRLLGAHAPPQIQLATAAAEVAHDALTHAGGCQIRFCANSDGQPLVLWVVARDAGPRATGERPSQGNLDQLVDVVHLSSTSDGGRAILLGKRIRRRRLSEQDARAMVQRLARSDARPSLQQIQEHNQELMLTLEQLHQVEQCAARRAAEWQATFDAIPDALCLLDDAGTITRANHAMAAFLNQPESAVTGQPWNRLTPFHAEERPAQALVEQARTTRLRAWHEHKLFNRWYRIQVDPLLGEANLVQRFVLLIVDITEEKRASERLRQINDALEAYAHSISHDIKGPLAGAVTANQVLQRLLRQPLTDRSRAQVRELGQLMSVSISHALDLVNEVLALAETGSGPGGSTDVRQVVGRVLHDRRGMLEQRGVRVTVDDELGQVMVAPAHLYQLFANLVDNAVKHGGAGELIVHIRRLHGEQPGVHRFVVRDSGPGIPPELGHRAFECFVRGDATGGRGNGIGLATVQRLAATYGGQARAYNDGGACIEVELHDADR